MVGHLDDRRPAEVLQDPRLHAERVQARRIVAALAAKALLTIVNPAQNALGLLGHCRSKGHLLPPDDLSSKLHKSPLFRVVHINQPLRRPNPVVRAAALYFDVFTHVGSQGPLHPRKIDPPLIAIHRRHLLVRGLGQHGPRESHLHRPALVLVSWVVDAAPHAHGRLQTGDVPSAYVRTAVAIGLDHQQIPLRAEGIDLKLVVLMRIAVRVDKNLEIVFLVNRRIAPSDGSPHVRLLQIGGYV